MGTHLSLGCSKKEWILKVPVVPASQKWVYWLRAINLHAITQYLCTEPCLELPQNLLRQKYMASLGSAHYIAMQTSTMSISLLSKPTFQISHAFMFLSTGKKIQDRTSVASSVWKKKSNQASVQWWKVRLPFTQTRGPWTAPYAKPIWETMIRNETLWQFHLEVSTNGQPCKWVALSVSVKWASNLQWPLTVNNIRQSYSANFINSQKFKRK